MTDDRLKELIKDPEYGEFCFNHYKYCDDQVEKQTEHLRKTAKMLTDLYEDYKFRSCGDEIFDLLQEIGIPYEELKI